MFEHYSRTEVRILERCVNIHNTKSGNIDSEPTPKAQDKTT